MLKFDVVVNHVSVTYDVGVNMLLVLTRNCARKNRKTKMNFDTLVYLLRDLKDLCSDLFSKRFE